ncbi:MULTISPECIES: PspC domain-containing protein [Crossiella]|uniref:Phage shock protein C n=1 Tax=Crossiella cryophila TaxID=43355 RepID=A0A7W7CLE1_9PSEU|nr:MULTISPECIES: PspC domain-containing protein [Crossiella]MBB4681961.1 phage shock protein C [Crossiella cryophila]MCK2242535.1 PspC domain-containing protein [Crossiella sp. S99.2]MCK2254435.1 PspC domain-containing protein [Crossiella sp. S99.1]
MSAPIRSRRLARSRNSVFFGVAGGIAERFGWKPGTVRLAFVISCVLPGPQFLLYLLLALFMRSPEKY